MPRHRLVHRGVSFLLSGFSRSLFEGRTYFLTLISFLTKSTLHDSRCTRLSPSAWIWMFDTSNLTERQYRSPTEFLLLLSATISVEMSNNYDGSILYSTLRHWRIPGECFPSRYMVVRDCARFTVLEAGSSTRGLRFKRFLLFRTRTRAWTRTTYVSAPLGCLCRRYQRRFVLFHSVLFELRSILLVSAFRHRIFMYRSRISFSLSFFFR